MISKIKLKLAEISDLDAMQQAGDTLFDYAVKPDRALEFINDPRHHLVLAYDNELIIGMASGFHYIHPDKDPALFINEVSVIEAYQNRGIGREIVQYLCEYGKKLDCTETWVATEQSNTAARKAYVAAGGTEDKEPIVMYVWEY